MVAWWWLIIAYMAGGVTSLIGLVTFIMYHDRKTKKHVFNPPLGYPPYTKPKSVLKKA